MLGRHRERESIIGGKLPSDENVEAILSIHGQGRKILPIKFSRSASEYPEAISGDAYRKQILQHLPDTRVYYSLSNEVAQAREELSERLVREHSFAELVTNSKRYLKSVRNGPFKETLKQTLAAFDRSKSNIIELMTILKNHYPQLESVPISKKGVPPIKEFLDAVSKKPLDSDDMESYSTIANVYTGLLNAFVPIVYPKEYAAIWDKYDRARNLQGAAKSELQEDLGFSPPALKDEAQRMLTQRHGISEDAINSGHTGIYNGSSAIVMLSAVKALDDTGDVLTPEYHWDGYEGLFDHRLKEMPRSESVRHYIESHYKNPGKRNALACILITNPCSITGKEYGSASLRELLQLSKQYNIPLVFNEMHAGPSASGKIFESITGLPEYEAVKDKVMIIGSTTKTSHISSATPKFSYFYTHNKLWAENTQYGIRYEGGRHFDRDDMARILSYHEHVNQDYWLANEKTSHMRRNQVEQWMQQVNKSTGIEAVKWHMGRPDKGYISAIEFAPELLKKAQVNNSLELFEYLYKVAGISVGEMMPAASGKETSRIAVRINYGLKESDLNIGLALMKHAVEEMQRGLTLGQAKEICPNRKSGGFIEGGSLEDVLSSLFGPNVRIINMPGRGYAD